MRPTAYPQRELSDADILWWVSFVKALGRRTPNGMTGLCWAVYPVVASSREDALVVLSQSNNVEWDMRCCGLLALRAGEQIRICDFDLARRLVTKFDPSGLDVEGHHHYAIVERWPAEGEVVFPTRGEAAWAREQSSREQDAEFSAGNFHTRPSFNELPPAARSLIRKRRGCWLWQGATINGYGRVYHAGENWSVHRLTYTLFRGEIPQGAVLRHLCHQPACCNPDHLRPGTSFANKADEKMKKEVRKLFRTPGLSEDARLLQLHSLYGLN